MSNEQREAHFRRIWDEFWHGPDYAPALEKWLTDDFQMRIASLPDPIPKAAWIGFVGGWHNAFPDGRMDIEKLVVNGDELWVYWISTGTHSNEYLGVPTSGNKVAYKGMEIYRFQGDRIADCEAIPDALSLFKQMGAG